MTESTAIFVLTKEFKSHPDYMIIACTAMNIGLESVFLLLILGQTFESVIATSIIRQALAKQV